MGQSQGGGHGPGCEWGKKKKKTKGQDATSKLPLVTLHTQCRLKLLKNQEETKPLEEKQEEERSKVDDLRGTLMSVGTLEEIIDDNHAIMSTSVGSEHYVSVLSFVNKDLLEPGCSALLRHKVYTVIGVLMDEMDPLVTMTKETYANTGVLDQIQETKESMELPLIHPEYYEEMGIKPPKGVIVCGPPGTGKTLLAALTRRLSSTCLMKRLRSTSFRFTQAG
ncbi:hypothetical protein H8957_014998 [Semnopithecus entellus]